MAVFAIFLSIFVGFATAVQAQTGREAGGETSDQTEAPEQSAPPVESTAPASASGAAVLIPSFRDPNRRLEAPDIATLPAIRFLTTDDYPPFNYLSESGEIIGYNIDLARAICNVLSVGCIIQVRPWGTLLETVAEAPENAILAGVADTAEAREALAFTNRYLTAPGRFVTAKAQATGIDDAIGAVSAARVGIVEGSAHARFVETFAPDARRFEFATLGGAALALKAGVVDFIFGDAIALSLWLHDESSEDCCAFAGGAFDESAFFGAGLSIAVAADNELLLDALNFALDRIEASGTHRELYLMHFPVGIY